MKSSKKVFLLLSACLGNLFEHYDTALFSLLAPFLASEFFPHQDLISGLIMTYAIIPIGILARPLGSLVFGYISDTYGRQRSLMLSLLGMAIVTIFMGLMPNYKQVGALAPLLLLLGRALQHFFAAGETIGGAVYLIENTSTENHNLMSSLYSASTMGGILLASIAVSILSFTNFIEQGWRLLYFIGGLTACFGYFFRFQLKSEQTSQTKIYNAYEILLEFWNRRKTLLIIALAAGFSYASYTTAFILINGLIPLVSPFSIKDMIHLNTFLLTFDLLLLPLFGFLGNWFSSEKLMITASIAAVLLGIPLFNLLDGTSWIIVILARMGIILIGVGFSANFYAWSQKLVPTSIRCSFVGFAYALGSQIIGSPTAVISLWLYQQTQIISSASWYWVILGGLSAIAISKKTRSSLARLSQVSPK